MKKSSTSERYTPLHPERADRVECLFCETRTSQQRVFARQPLMPCVLLQDPLYSVDWCHSGDGLLAVSTGAGCVALARVDKGLIAQYNLHSGKKVFRVVFSPLVPEQLASCGSDNSVAVWDTTGKVIKRMSHPRCAGLCRVPNA